MSSSLSSIDRTPKRLYLLIALALTGLILSVILTQHFYEVRSGTAGFKSLCHVSSTMNCDAVAASSYSEIFAGIPLSSLAAGWYLAILGMALFGLIADWRRESLRGLALMSSISVLMTLSYLYVMAAILHTYCLYCLLLDGVSLLSFGVALSLKPETPAQAPVNTSQWKTLGMISAACLFVMIVILHGFDNSKAKSSDIALMVQSALNEPVLAVTAAATYPSLGPTNAPVTIEEFSDFECPYCRLGAMSLATVLNRYPTQVRVIFRNFPLDMSCNSHVQNPMHQFSCEAARAALCAHKQGQFQALYEELFEKQETLSSGKPLEFAKNLGIDIASLQSCMADPQTNLAIQTDIEEGSRLGITSTPTFFINGRKIEGIQPNDAWNKIIDQLLLSHGT